MRPNWQLIAVWVQKKTFSTSSVTFFVAAQHGSAFLWQHWLEQRNLLLNLSFQVFVDCRSPSLGIGRRHCHQQHHHDYHHHHHHHHHHDLGWLTVFINPPLLLGDLHADLMIRESIFRSPGEEEGGNCQRWILQLREEGCQGRTQQKTKKFCCLDQSRVWLSQLIQAWNVEIHQVLDEQICEENK